MNEQETFQTTMGINFTNFDVNNIQEAETINVVLLLINHLQQTVLSMT